MTFNQWNTMFWSHGLTHKVIFSPEVTSIGGAYGVAHEWVLLLEGWKCDWFYCIETIAMVQYPSQTGCSMNTTVFNLQEFWDPLDLSVSGLLSYLIQAIIDTFSGICGWLSQCLTAKRLEILGLLGPSQRLVKEKSFFSFISLLNYYWSFCGANSKWVLWK